MPAFSTVTNPTPYGIFDADTEYQAEADALVTFVKRKLGDDIVGVELTSKQIWNCLEESVLEFGALVNQYQAKSQLATLIGTPSGSFTTSSLGQSHRLPREQLSFLRRMTEPYSTEGGVGGSYSGSFGYFELQANRQDYDFYTEMKDSTTNQVAFSQLTGSQRTKMKIVEVFHFDPQAAYRFFDSTSAINYLNNEFSFESFTPETIFYVLPVFEDVLRAQQMQVSQRVRRSNYSYSIYGSKLRIYPMPTNSPAPPTKLWVLYQPWMDPYNPDYDDESLFGVSNLSNVPYGNFQYSQINSIGRQWIRQYAFALARETLGQVRSKFESVPVPNGNVRLDGAEMVSRGREDQKRLRDELREILDSLTYAKLAEQEATKAEALRRQLATVPMPANVAITIY